MRNDWPPHGAFVLQFGVDSDLGAGRIEGRVEHVASLRAARFRSLGELVAFCQEAMDGAKAQESEENREF